MGSKIPRDQLNNKDWRWNGTYIGSGDVQVMYLIKKISESEITSTTGSFLLFLC